MCILHAVLDDSKIRVFLVVERDGGIAYSGWIIGLDRWTLYCYARLLLSIAQYHSVDYRRTIFFFLSEILVMQKLSGL